MMSRPFPTYVALPGSAPSANWQVYLQLEGTPDDLARRELHFVFDHFWTVMGRGAFIRPGTHPAHASLQVVAREVAPLNEVCWNLRTVNVDGRFAQVLRNTCVAFSFTTWAVKELRVIALRPGESVSSSPLQSLPPLADDWSLNVNRYPPAYAPVNFPIVSQIRGANSPRRYEIEYSSALTDEQCNHFVRTLASWGEVGLGGFAETEGELTGGECAIFNVSAQRFDDSTIELTMDRFAGGEPARNALVNLLCYSDRTIAGIRNVTEEQ
jgi:hypothetical protein